MLTGYSKAEGRVLVERRSRKDAFSLRLGALCAARDGVNVAGVDIARNLVQRAQHHRAGNELTSVTAEISR